ncbi:MAG: amidohydrolase family protein [Alphaproteobacteria bacterium]|nr:amidohydrolase family protein [Alphaproteobacteria bacterium]
MSLATARTVDIHAHAVLPGVLGKAGTYGPELTADAEGTPVFRIGDYRLRGVKYANSPFMDPELRIAAMDRCGIDWQLLSPNPLTYFHYIPAEDAVPFNRAHNDMMAELVARYPDRLGGTAALPMQDIDAAIVELERAVGELGLLGAYIGTDFPTTLDDPRMDPFYETLVKLDVPLFLHPAPAGIDGPAAPPQMQRYELDILYGFTGQETVAMATLLFGGVLHRHPGLDVCISHGGGALALIHGRLGQAIARRKWVPDWLREPGALDATLRRVWYDIHMNDDRALDLLIERVGTDRLVYGTNFAGWDQPETVHVPDTPIDLAGNARRLLRA